MTFERTAAHICLALWLAWGVQAKSIPPYAVPRYATLSDSWPSFDSWSTLNSSVSGKLSALRPWTAVCYASDPLFDEHACSSVRAGYTAHLKRQDTPAALLWENYMTCGFEDACPLDLTDPQVVQDRFCGQGSVPPFSVAVEDAREVSTVVQWAVQHRVKLTIKNTGHDYLGRSTGPSTLQVWTHPMQSLIFEDAFVPRGSHNVPVPAVTFGAGATAEQVYGFVMEHNKSVALGGCMSVGAAGGYMQSGGHGVLTPVKGLMVDNVLEIEIVTMDGVVRIVNEVQDPDLFWAVRGGGPATFGIVTSVTLAVHDPVPVSSSILTIVPNPDINSSDLAVKWLELTGKYANQWLEYGIGLANIVDSSGYNIQFYWPASSGDLSILYPFYEELFGLSESFTVTANVTSEESYPSLEAAMFDHVGPFFDSIHAWGAKGRWSSRIIPRTRLADQKSISEVARAIWEGQRVQNAAAGAPGTLGEIPMVILGDMPVATRERAHRTGANPALYEGTWHTIYSYPWFFGASEETSRAIGAAVHSATGPLTRLGITGSYQNEASAYEENWQETFFGSKYPRLLDIKQKYDPHNFLNNWQGVGFVEDAEAWRCLRKSSPHVSSATPERYEERYQHEEL